MEALKRFILPGIEGFSNLNISTKFVCLAFALQGVLRGSALSYSDSTLSTPTTVRVLIYASYVTLLLILAFTFLSIRITALVIPPLLYWGILTLDAWGGAEIQGVLITAELLLFCLQPAEIRRMVFSMYRWLIFVMALIGAICSVSYMLGLPIPYNIVDYYAEANRGLRYADYGVTYLYVNTWSASFRLCGLFNEPGYFGTIIALLLCADSFDFRKSQNTMLLVAGILTFSLAFIVMTAVGIVMSYVSNRKAIVPTVLVGLVCMVVLPQALSDYGLVSIVDRITGIFNGAGLAERSNALIDSELMATISGQHVFWGNGGGYVNSITTGTSSYKNVVIDYGLCGAVIVMFSPLIAAVGISKGKYPCIMLILLFFLCVMQRPNINTLSYYIVLFGGIPYILDKYSKPSKSAF